MNDNVNQPASCQTGDTSSEKSFEQGGRRNNNRSRNNRRRRSPQQEGGESTVLQNPRPSGGPQSNPVNQPIQNQRQSQPPRQDSQPRTDFHSNQRRSGKPPRPQQNQGQRHPDKVEPNTDRFNQTGRNEQNAGPNRNPNQQPRNERQKESRNWGRHIRSEETFEDVKRENERLEKEIWLEIADIHTMKLD